VFLHNYANAIWSLKRSKGLPLSVVVYFLQQRISITLPRMQTSSILSWAIVVDLIISLLPLGHTFIAMVDLLQVVGC
jgi:hypothetical protein